MSNKRRSDARKATHRKERPVRRPVGKWQHEMVLPLDPKDVLDLWRFVAAHVEDPARCRSCPVAVKAWRFLDGGSSEVEERQGLPVVLPECAGGATTDDGKNVRVWTERYSCGSERQRGCN